MNLRNKKTNKQHKADISSLKKEDYDWILKSDQYEFDWKIEKKNSVYKIYLVENKENILGVISLMDIPKEWRIHINLIEISAANIGRNKTYDYIAGCLIAFACSFAFEKQYNGFVSLQPKTNLVELYHEKYGFIMYGAFMAVEAEQAKFLIKKYLQS